MIFNSFSLDPIVGFRQLKETTSEQQLLVNTEKVSIGSGLKYPGRMTTRAGVALGLVTTAAPLGYRSAAFCVFILSSVAQAIVAGC